MNKRQSIAEQCAQRKAERATNAQIKREIAQEAFETFVDVGDMAARLDIIVEELWFDSQPTYEVTDEGPVMIPPKLTQVRLLALKEIKDITLKKLNKLVGDKKSVEMTGADGVGLFGRESREELEANLRRMGMDPDVIRAHDALR